ncbi:MAG: hypothetical protein KDA99_30300, partial [Planctomycetales bacterium]|nr:hypothetical protein [Planctomycetales bacterium]
MPGCALFSSNRSLTLCRQLVALSRLAMVCSLVIAQAGSFSTSARAGTGDTVTLPANPRMARNKLQLRVSSYWIDGNGYRPYTIVVRPMGTSTFGIDRQLRVVLTVSRLDDRQGPELQVTQDIELPGAATVAEAVVLVPQSWNHNYLDIETFESGGRLSDLSARDVSVRSTGEWMERLPSILVVTSSSSTFPKVGSTQDENVTQLLNVLATTAATQAIMGSQGNSPSAAVVDRINASTYLNYPKLEVVPLSDVPEQWLGLTSVDLLIVSLSDLHQLSVAEPARLEAVLAWSRAGGNLVVTDVGEEYTELQVISSLLALADRPSSEPRQPPMWKSVAHPQWLGWDVVPLFNAGNEITGYTEYLKNQDAWNAPMPIAQANTTIGNPPVPNTGRPIQVPDMPPFLTRPNEFGMVVLAGKPKTQVADNEWAGMLSELKTDRFLWYQRHGVTKNRENMDYWNFLIPGVGVAPVGAFLVLISLFALVIGPVNYFLLRRMYRLSWLLWTVPIGALTVVLGLFAYALFTDGLGVRSQTRSVTFLDQTAGHAVAWSRHTYYAGIVPSEGLSFSHDTHVIPIDPICPNEYAHINQHRELEWGQRQRLGNGYLRSRVASQFLAIRSCDSSVLLSVKLDKDRPGEIPSAIENRLGGAVERVVVSADHRVR